MRSGTWSRRTGTGEGSSPSVPIGQEFEPGGVTADDLPDRGMSGGNEAVIEGFRKLVRMRLGDLGLGVFDARMAGQETKSLVGREDLGRPGKFVIKRVVQEIKALAREHARPLVSRFHSGR